MWGTVWLMYKPRIKDVMPNRLMNRLSMCSLFVNNSAVTYRSGRTFLASSSIHCGVTEREITITSRTL